MRPIVKYAGRELTGPSEWTVSFDLVAEPAPVQHDLAGRSAVGSQEPIAHLFLADQVDGPAIWLWAPAGQEAEADSRLAAAGFEIGS